MATQWMGGLIAAGEVYVGNFNGGPRSRHVHETAFRAALSAIHPYGATIVTAAEVSEAIYHAQGENYKSYEQQNRNMGMNDFDAAYKAWEQTTGGWDFP